MGDICQALFKTPPTHDPPTFGMIKDADNIYYCTKNQVRGVSLGGDLVIRARPGEYYQDSKKALLRIILKEIKKNNKKAGRYIIYVSQLL